MKNVLILSALCWLLASCSGNDGQKTASTDTPAAGGSSDIEKYDPERGTGKFTNVDVPPTLDQAMATAGQKIADVKCASCHKLTDEKLVGPGWKGVTQRHKPEWIMNFVTNVDDMLAKDPKAQAMLEICLVRMPNQNLTDEDARSVYEFMRKNDGVK